MVAHLGLGQFAARVRATDQLTRLYGAWLAADAADGGATGRPSSAPLGAAGAGAGGGTCAEGGDVQDLCAGVIATWERHCRGGAAAATTALRS